MKFWPSFLVVSVLLALPQIMTSQQGDATAGKAVYTKNCASCHGASGEGKEAIAKALKVELRHLGSPEVQAKSNDALHKDVADGIGKMKPAKGLNEKDLNNLIAHLRALAKK